jgi:hypothetical protein
MEWTVGWDRGADRTSNDADVSSIPPIIPPSRPGEFHPESLTDPDVILSHHPARATQ